MRIVRMVTGSERWRLITAIDRQMPREFEHTAANLGALARYMKRPTRKIAAGLEQLAREGRLVALPPVKRYEPKRWRVVA